MTRIQSTHVSATCTYCSAVNDMLVLDVRAQQEVNCSRCGAPLGRLGELRNGGDPESDLPATERQKTAASGA